MTPRRIALTGGRGRIARFAAVDLARRGYDVTTFSRSADTTNRDLCLLPSMAGEFDAILHLGWSTLPRTAEDNPGSEQHHDLPFLRELLSAVRPTNTRLVFFSTTAVYGNVEIPSDEDTPCRPLGRYAAGKLAAENLIAEQTARTACILRVSNVFGFSAHAEKPQGVIPMLCDAARNGQPVAIWGNGSATKDYLFHEDFLEALHRVLERRLTGLFNLASGRSYSLRDIIHFIEKVSGRALDVRYTPHFEWDVERTVLSAEKLSAATGWRPQHDVEEGIRALFSK